MTWLKFQVTAKQLCISALLVSQFGLLLPPSAMAANNNVKIAGKVVIVNRTGFGGQTTDQRTESIQENIDNALAAATDRSPGAVKVKTVKGVSVITLAGYKIVTVDNANAKLAKTTAPVLAMRWANSLRKALSDTAAVDDYVANLSGNSTTAVNEPAVAPPRTSRQKGSVDLNVADNSAYQNNISQQQQQQQQQNLNAQAAAQINNQPMQGRVSYAPAGLTIPIQLSTSISTSIAQAGDMIQGSINQSIDLGNGQIPAGSVVIGQVTDSAPGRRMDRSGSLSIKFNRLRTPDGVETPMSAHLVGGIGKYSQSSAGSDTVHGEGMKNKIESVGIRGAVGAGTGAALGTAIGAIAGGGHGVGKGAWSGAAIGGGLGVADSLLLRKAADVVLAAGTQMQLQLDAPLSIGQQ